MDSHLKNHIPLCQTIVVLHSSQRRHLSSAAEAQLVENNDKFAMFYFIKSLFPSAETRLAMHGQAVAAPTQGDIHLSSLNMSNEPTSQGCVAGFDALQL